MLQAGRVPHLQLRGRGRRPSHADQPRAARRRPRQQHALPAADLRRAGLETAQVRAHADDPRPGPQAPQQAPRRHQRRGVPRPGHPARRDDQLPGAAGLVARRLRRRGVHARALIKAF